MPTICRAFASEDAAHAAVVRVQESMIVTHAIRVLMGERRHDARDAAVGRFDGAPAGRAELVGSFAGGPRPAHETMGAYAGRREDARRGGFADRDRDVVVSVRAGGVATERVATHRNLLRALTDAGLDEPAARRDVEALHAGQVLVLVTGDDAAVAAAAGRLDEVR
jgi:hypothetical protein